MTNPGNIVRIRSRTGGRASVYEANMWAQGRTKGLMSGSGVVQNGTPNMSVLVGGSSTNPDVVIAENPAGYKIALDLIGQQSLTVTAPASNSRITSIVAYTDDLSVASTQTAVTGSPASCGLILVNGTTSATPAAPTDAAIRSAITGDGAAGSQASYAVIAEIPVASTTTSLTNQLIANKRSLLNTLATGDSFVLPSTGVVAVSSGLTCTISDITYYISGIRYTKTGIPNKTFTASKDTYCFIDTAGTITYTEVANNAASPVAPANSILFAVVVTNASAVVNIYLYDQKPAFSFKRSAAFAVSRSTLTRYAFDTLEYSYGENRTRLVPGDSAQGSYIVIKPGIYHFDANVVIQDDPVNASINLYKNNSFAGQGSNSIVGYPALQLSKDIVCAKDDIIDIRINNLRSDRDPGTGYQNASFTGHLVRPV